MCVRAKRDGRARGWFLSRSTLPFYVKSGGGGRSYCREIIYARACVCVLGREDASWGEVTEVALEGRGGRSRQSALTERIVTTVWVEGGNKDTHSSDNEG